MSPHYFVSNFLKEISVIVILIFCLNIPVSKWLNLLLWVCLSDKMIPLLYLSVSVKSVDHVTSLVSQYCEFQIKNANLWFQLLFGFFFVFHLKICVFIIFISSFPFHFPLANQAQEFLVKTCRGNCMLIIINLQPWYS